MSGRIYSWIANGALVLGIASAFLYDSAKVPHVLAVAAGIVAGMTAVALYFWNQQECKKKGNKEAQEVVVETAPKLEAAKKDADIVATWAKALTQTATLDLQKRILAELWRTHVAPDVVYFHAHANASRKWMANYYVHQGFLPGRSLRYAFPKETRVMTPEVELSPREAAACAIEIMLNLAIQDKLNEWEYIFDAKGLRVSMKRPYGVRPVSSQEVLRFDSAEAFAE
jgi:hypothetical protein